MQGHLDILKNTIENALDSQMYPPVEASGGQEQSYIRSPLHFSAQLIFSPCRGKSHIGIFLGDLSS